MPDPALRQALLAELHPQPWRFWDEPVPVFDAWPDAPCAYLRFGTNPAYAAAATEAQHRGWPYHQLDAAHFHMLLAPNEVAEALLKLWKALSEPR